MQDNPATNPSHLRAKVAHSCAGEFHMSAVIVLSVVVAAVAVVSYLERKSLKSKVDAIELKAKSDFANFVLALRSKESQLRAKISADVSKVVAEAKAEATKIELELKRMEAEAKVDVSSVAHRAEALVLKLEADLKKAI